jgi:hypothetical protein
MRYVTVVSVTRWFQSAVDSNRQKEQFSDAFIRAVAAAAGYAVSKPSVDDDSIDWQIAATGGQGTTRSPRLELQLKCRTNLNVLADAFRLPLEVKNFNDLVPENVMVPRILVLVIVPSTISDWVTLTHDALVLRNSAYWVSLRGKNPSENAETETVGIPRSQHFDVTSLSTMMSRIGSGELP